MTLARVHGFVLRGFVGRRLGTLMMSLIGPVVGDSLIGCEVLLLLGVLVGRLMMSLMGCIVGECLTGGEVFLLLMVSLICIFVVDILQDVRYWVVVSECSTCKFQDNRRLSYLVQVLSV